MMTSHMRRAGSGLVDLAGDEAIVVGDVAFVRGPFAPHVLGGILQLGRSAFEFLLAHGEGELPVGVVAHGVHELIGDEQAQVELAQAAVLALGA